MSRYKSNRGISSDDPEAIQKLKDKLEGLEKLREKIKATNKIVRRKPKNKKAEDKIKELVNLGYSQQQAVKLFEPDFCGRIGVPSYELTNLGGNIRQVKERIEKLSAMEGKENYTIDFAGGEITVNYEVNRVQVHHGEKPPKEIRQRFKSAGFVFSWENISWRRYISDYAICLAKQICGVEGA